MGSLHRHDAVPEAWAPGTVVSPLCPLHLRFGHRHWKAKHQTGTLKGSHKVVPAVLESSRIIWEFPHKKKEWSSSKKWFVTVVRICKCGLWHLRFLNRKKITTPKALLSQNYIWRGKSFRVWGFRYFICNNGNFTCCNHLLWNLRAKYYIMNEFMFSSRT